jgi:hypothetical protein
MAPADGSGQHGRAAGCGTRRGGGGTYARQKSVALIGGLRPCCADEREGLGTDVAGHDTSRAQPPGRLGARDLGPRDLGRARVDLEAEGGRRPEARRGRACARVRGRARRAMSRRGVSWPETVPLYPCLNV